MTNRGRDAQARAWREWERIHQGLALANRAARVLALRLRADTLAEKYGNLWAAADRARLASEARQAQAASALWRARARHLSATQRRIASDLRRLQRHWTPEMWRHFHQDSATGAE
ncbi:MAG: hypothetical protein IVW57_00575 [Ktedonobacterales bacterium]|nr:hypothetical protein [Ktedonobacterales bacterium]